VDRRGRHPGPGRPLRPRLEVEVLRLALLEPELVVLGLIAEELGRLLEHVLVLLLALRRDLALDDLDLAGVLSRRVLDDLGLTGLGARRRDGLGLTGVLDRALEVVLDRVERLDRRLEVMLVLDGVERLDRRLRRGLDRRLVLGDGGGARLL
jgi:hypothetical protein